ncbi:MAG TPA: hypothetical protein VGU25_06450 [Acidobacteriaceae bacterium]|nr:hypothetical protein [Acidobacteriaceae bacterium]
MTERKATARAKATAKATARAKATAKATARAKAKAGLVQFRVFSFELRVKTCVLSEEGASGMGRAITLGILRLRRTSATSLRMTVIR